MHHPANVRDLGGLPLVGGGTTRHGVLLRGDAPYAGDGPPPGVVWPPRTVIDLRSGRERERRPYEWPADTVIHSRALFDAGDLASLPHDVTLMTVYDGMVASAGPVIAALVDLVGDGPTYVHCTAGKDRTGMAIAALLLLAGVEEEAVVADYRRTETAMERVMDRIALSQSALSRFKPEWVTAPLEAVQLMIDHVTAWPGGVRAWFLDHGATAEGIDRFVTAIRD